MNVLSKFPSSVALIGVGGLTATAASADPVETWSGGYGHMWGGMMGGGLMMLVFWGVLIAVIVLIVRALMSGRSDPASSGQGGVDAVEVLRARFARGEIEEEEFRRRKALLDE